MKKAICIGINNYPGSSNDLQGCVNDANDWSALLTGYGFETSVILDAQATRQNVKAALTSLVTAAGEGDVIVFTYSGHGTQVMDTSGDESDSSDEALYVYDGTVLDDDLRSIINQVNTKATLVVISDSCFSGTVTRLVADENARPRFMRVADIPAGTPVRKHFLLPEANMPEVLISGCSDSEYSYDAVINGRPNGAMTAMAIQVIKQNPNVTYAQFYTSLRTRLPSNSYPQTPQLEGSDDHKNTPLFEPFGTSAPPPPPPPDDNPGCPLGLIRWVGGLFKKK